MALYAVLLLFTDVRTHNWSSEWSHRGEGKEHIPSAAHTEAAVRVDHKCRRKPVCAETMSNSLWAHQLNLNCTRLLIVCIGASTCLSVLDVAFADEV